MIHDVNNSLPPVVERGMDHEGMSHAGHGGRGWRVVSRLAEAKKGEGASLASLPLFCEEEEEPWSRDL